MTDSQLFNTSDHSPEDNSNLKEAVSQILKALKEPFDAEAAAKIPTPHQDRIKALIAEAEEIGGIESYHDLRRKLESERSFFEVEAPRLRATRLIEDLGESIDMDNAKLAIWYELDKPEPFYGDTVIEIDVPSGYLVIRDALTPVFTPAAVGSMRQGLETHQAAMDYAEDCNVASAFVGNSCPQIVQRKDGSYLVVSPEQREDGDFGNIYEDGEERIFSVITDSWSVELSDYGNWLDHGGKRLDEFSPDLLPVPPGRYRWVASCHKTGWSHYDFPRAEFATLTLIEPTVTPIEPAAEPAA